MTIIPSSMLTFHEEASENETAVCTVLSKHDSDIILGQIRYHAPFRSFTFFSASDAKFTHRALADLEAQLIAMSDDWAKASGKRVKHGKPALGRRCGATKPGDYRNPDAPAQMLPLVRCGRLSGHPGDHKALGSQEVW